MCLLGDFRFSCVDSEGKLSHMDTPRTHFRSPHLPNTFLAAFFCQEFPEDKPTCLPRKRSKQGSLDNFTWNVSGVSEEWCLNKRMEDDISELQEDASQSCSENIQGEKFDSFKPCIAS